METSDQVRREALTTYQARQGSMTDDGVRIARASNVRRHRLHVRDRHRRTRLSLRDFSSASLVSILATTCDERDAPERSTHWAGAGGSSPSERRLD